jgi:hypothetical protein
MADRWLRVGAALELLVCAAYVLYAVTVVRVGPDEPAVTSVIVTAVAVAFALTAASSLMGATCSAATEFLRFTAWATPCLDHDCCQSRTGLSS